VNVATLSWSLDIECPKCNEDNDLYDTFHNPEDHIAHCIFTNQWDILEGLEVTCEHCGYVFPLDKVEC